MLRLLASSVAARLDVTTDRIEDLKLAVAEACATLMSLDGGCETITMRITPSGDRLRVTVASDGRPGAERWPPPDVEGDLSWQILSALTKDARFEMTEAGPQVGFTLPGGVGG